MAQVVMFYYALIFFMAGYSFRETNLPCKDLYECATLHNLLADCRDGFCHMLVWNGDD
uniref:Nodule-specific cysteine-rich peptide L43 n=1 Tax=Lens culinaris TaxID=3864 RepID=A0A7T8DVQ9_LENCU|nr:nodule-specific cysteine-rich peptide L43 [Lens culinaris]